MSLLKDIFWAFLKPGIFGFGGGQAAIPLIQEEVVDKTAWLTEEQFVDYLAMGNTLPGPIATKMSVIIGYDLAGIPSFNNSNRPASRPSLNPRAPALPGVISVPPTFSVLSPGS